MPPIINVQRENILKRLLIHIAGFNLSLVLRLMIGKGTPRGLQDLALALALSCSPTPCTRAVDDGVDVPQGVLLLPVPRVPVLRQEDVSGDR